MNKIEFLKAQLVFSVGLVAIGYVCIGAALPLPSAYELKPVPALVIVVLGALVCWLSSKYHPAFDINKQRRQFPKLHAYSYILYGAPACALIFWFPKISISTGIFAGMLGAWQTLALYAYCKQQKS